jgi:2-polyprenyl-3-methyl-5-hydroxy-6-metoxy-1,4-benzoquinol methylase
MAAPGHSITRQQVLIPLVPVADPNAQDAFFDELAESSADRHEDGGALRDGLALFTQEARLVLHRLGSPRVPQCLDLGCGAGQIALAVAGVGFDVVGIDRSERMIAAAQRAAHRAGSQEKINFVQADVGEFLSASREMVPLVISSALLQYVDDPLNVVGLAASHVCAGGTLALSVPNFHSVLRTAEAWIQAILPSHLRDRKFWANELNAGDYVASAFDLGLSLEKVRTFGVPTSALGAFKHVLDHRWFQTMTLLVFRRL